MTQSVDWNDGDEDDDDGSTDTGADETGSWYDDAPITDEQIEGVRRSLDTPLAERGAAFAPFVVRKLLAEIDRLNVVLDANRVVRNAAESSSRTYKGAMELLKTQRTQLRAELAAANERAGKAESETVRLRMTLQSDAEGYGRVIADREARALCAEAERDEARARLAEIGKTGTLQFRACQSPNGPLIDWRDVVAGESAMITPWPDSAGRIRVDFRKVACRSCGTTERVFGDPPLCSNCAVYGAGLAKAADAAQDGRGVTETSELQFDASVPATKPEGAQRGAQGLCESERNDETGTER